jgi:hypothetical protein
MLADRLASMSMDIDTGLYTILRRGDTGADALKIIASAAKITKKAVSCYFELRGAGGWPFG